MRTRSSRPTTNPSPGVVVAGIYLYEGATYRGDVYLFPDGTPLAAPVIDAANGRIFIHFNLWQLDAVLQLVREETAPSPPARREGSPADAGFRSRCPGAGLVVM